MLMFHQDKESCCNFPVSNPIRPKFHKVSIKSHLLLAVRVSVFQGMSLRCKEIPSALSLAVLLFSYCILHHKHKLGNLFTVISVIFSCIQTISLFCYVMSWGACVLFISKTQAKVLARCEVFKFYLFMLLSVLSGAQHLKFHLNLSVAWSLSPSVTFLGLCLHDRLPGISAICSMNGGQKSPIKVNCY